LQFLYKPLPFLRQGTAKVQTHPLGAWAARRAVAGMAPTAEAPRAEWARLARCPGSGQITRDGLAGRLIQHGNRNAFVRIS